MDNSNLKHLVKLYRTTKKTLEDLKSDYEGGKIEKELFEKLGKNIIEKIKITKDRDLGMWQTIQSGLWDKEWQEAYNKYDTGDKNIQTKESYNIAYLTAKLDCIKEMLGEEVVKEIEDNEKKKLLGGNNNGISRENSGS
jgi:hypothetical protein